MKNNEKVRCFFEKNRKKIESNPLIIGFLSNKDNLSLLEDYLINPTEDNKNKVDMEFKAHCIRARRISYISNLIHFFSQDYDKRRRKEKERNLLILDKTSTDDSEIAIIDLVKDNRQELNLPNSNLMEDVGDEDLIHALKTLTEKQLLILDLIYHKNMPLKEISFKLKTTPQNISNHHRTAIKKLRLHLLNKGEKLK
ncbi:sigma-70 family RNA polymerase sigma factor [Oceanobacillus luteolus]|uniref:Sigma-70 family RNA polymerase sigma factor n=1 Tax=Oceanobacillus luteolus TaxID=1274358 RepID=A0ABW4HUS3_9BACI